MFIVPVVVLVIIGVLSMMASFRLIADPTLAAQCSFVVTVVTFALLALAWRWLKTRERDPTEAARTAWLNQAPSATPAAQAAPVGESWRVLNGDSEP